MSRAKTKRKKRRLRKGKAVADGGRNGLPNGGPTVAGAVGASGLGAPTGNGGIPITANLNAITDRKLIQRAIKNKWGVGSVTMRSALRAYSKHVRRAAVIDEFYGEAVDKLLAMNRDDRMTEKSEREEVALALQEIKTVMEVIEFEEKRQPPATVPEPELMMDPEQAAVEAADEAHRISKKLAARDATNT